MKILTVLGSPRKNGNTAAVLSRFEALARAQHRVERIDLSDYTLQGCEGCDACLEALGQLGCVQGDVAMDLLERILKADLVVYASPVYVWNFPAPMKALLDRHYCMVKYKNGEVVQSLMKDKPVMLLTTCGGDAADNLDLIEEAFRREVDYVKARLVGIYGLANCTIPAELVERAGDTAARMLADLNWTAEAFERNT